MTDLELILLATTVVSVAAALYLALSLPGKLRRAKLETFTGLLNTLTFGLAPHDFEKRWERLAFALSGFLGLDDPQAAKWRLLRASFYRYFRPEPALVDVINDRGRLVIIEQISGDETAERLWDFFQDVIDGRESREPKEVFDDQELAEAQLQLEAQLIGMYDRKLRRKS